MSSVVNRSRLGDELDLEDERQEAEDGKLIASTFSYDTGTRVLAINCPFAI